MIQALVRELGHTYIEQKTYAALGLVTHIVEVSSFWSPLFTLKLRRFDKALRKLNLPVIAVHFENIFTVPPTPKGTPGSQVTMMDTLAAVGFPNVWKDSTFDGGTHVIIGSCDTGVDASGNGEYCFEDQPADGKPHTSRVGAHADYAGGPPYHAHGTWCMKFAARSPNVDGSWRGACYRAKIIYAQVLDINGQGSTTQVLDGLNWLVTQKCHVINMSLGGPHDATMNAGVEAAWNAGVIVCAAEGNSGHYPPACDGTINSPGDADDSIAVGACCIPSQSSSNQFEVQTWTDRGKRSDGTPVPFCITAPGLAIQPGPTDPVNSGTSFATPHNTGAVGVCVDKALSLGLSGVDMNTRIRTALMTTAKKLGYENNFPADQAYCIQGNGLLQADAARASLGTTPPPPPPPSSNVAQHTYTVSGSYPAKVTVTDANGNSQVATVQITVSTAPPPPPPPPANPLQVSLVADKTQGQAPLTVNFTANATGGTGPYTYQWNFGD